MKYLFILLVSFLLLIFVFNTESLPPDLARIHVVANSDSDEDIKIKMEVAEAITRVLGEEKFDSSEKIGEGLKKRLTDIEETATKVMEKFNVNYGVSAEVSVKHFDKKSLGNALLPEGDYTALIVTLGEGEGHNWWSVIFPELTLRASLASGEEGGDGKTFVVGGVGVVRLRSLLRELFLSIDKR